MEETSFDKFKGINIPLVLASIFVISFVAACQQIATPAAGEAMTSPKDGMVVLYVPAGEFTMGSTEDEALAKTHEFPQHQVYLDAFWIDQTEVTNAMFAQFLNEVGNQEGGGRAWLNVPRTDPQLKLVDGVWSPKPGFENYPAAELTWYGAEAYCKWAGRRLPTEAEWEKAARGTDAQIYPWGNDDPTCELTNYDFFCWVRHSVSVGSYPEGQSPYGALDMSGNMMEVVADYYAADYYEQSPDRNPIGPATGEFRVAKGGSFFMHEIDVRSARRANVLPTGSGPAVGFRCALPAEN